MWTRLFLTRKCRRGRKGLASRRRRRRGAPCPTAPAFSQHNLDSHVLYGSHSCMLLFVNFSDFLFIYFHNGLCPGFLDSNLHGLGRRGEKVRQAVEYGPNNSRISSSVVDSNRFDSVPALHTDLICTKVLSWVTFQFKFWSYGIWLIFSVNPPNKVQIYESGSWKMIEMWIHQTDQQDRILSLFYRFICIAKQILVLQYFFYRIVTGMLQTILIAVFQIRIRVNFAP